MSVTAAVIMIAIGLAMAGIWTRDIVAGAEVDRSAGLFRAREAGTDSLFWLHWLAEYGTAAALMTAAAALLAGAGWGRPLAFLAIGALVYSATNALGWAFGRRERYPYAAPMLVSLVGAIAVLVLVLAS